MSAPILRIGCNGCGQRPEVEPRSVIVTFGQYVALTFTCPGCGRDSTQLATPDVLRLLAVGGASVQREWLIPIPEMHDRARNAPEWRPGEFLVLHDRLAQIDVPAIWSALSPEPQP